MADVLERLTAMLREFNNVDPEKASMDAHLADDLQLDSLDMVELLMRTEETFGLEIPEEEAERMETVGDVVEYVEKHLDQGG